MDYKKVFEHVFSRYFEVTLMYTQDNDLSTFCKIAGINVESKIRSKSY